MVKKSYKVAIGLVVLAIGVSLLADSMGWITIPGLPTSVITQSGQTLGIQLSTNIKAYNFLALVPVTAGNSFKWKVHAANTGTLSWATGWVNTRLGKNGATAVSVTCASNPNSCPDVNKPVGSFMVESYNSVIDEPTGAGREDIATTWGFKFSADPGCATTGTCNWLACPGGQYPTSTVPSTYNNKVCAIDIGTLTAGNALDIYYKLTVPSTGYTTGSFPLITQAMAFNGASYAIAGKSDTLQIGSVTGTLTLEFLGAVGMSIIGLGLLIWATV